MCIEKMFSMYPKMYNVYGKSKINNVIKNVNYVFEKAKF